MKIKPGNYVRVRSDEELLLALSLFYAGGFPHWCDGINMRSSYEEGGGICVLAEEGGECDICYIDYVMKTKENPIEIFLPSPESLIESLD